MSSQQVGFTLDRRERANEQTMLLLLEDPRVQGLAAHVGAWSVLWIAILLVVPAGVSGRNHIVSLNAAHGVVCTVVAALTVLQSLDTTNSVAVSLSYFLVDFVAMVRGDGLRNLLQLNRSRQMDYAHHVLGLVWGFVFFVLEAHVCDARMGNPYVWIQTNEVSTPFYNWFRLTNSKVAGALFALSFFGSRIVFNSAFLIPRFAAACDLRYLVACVPFFLLQYVWFAMIVNKMLRTLTPKDKVAKTTAAKDKQQPELSPKLETKKEA